MVPLQRPLINMESSEERSGNEYYILNCSFGKDSMAMLKICAEREREYPIDEVCYIDIRYDATRSAEYPEHEKFIQEVGIPYIIQDLGLPLHIVHPEHSYKDLFFRVFKKGPFAGKYYGFSVRGTPKCNSIKVKAMEQRIKEITATGYKPVKYVGIAADEKKRIEGARKRGEILPLVDLGITEGDAIKICKKEGTLSPIYNNPEFERIGCFFCPNSRVNQFKYLYKTNPELLADLAELDQYSPFRFHPPYTATDLWNKFSGEEKEQKALTEF